MDDNGIAKVILFVAMMFFLPIALHQKVIVKEVMVEPETVTLEVHLEKRTVNETVTRLEDAEGEVIEEESEEEVIEEQEVVQQERPVPNIVSEPEPMTNGNLVKMRLTCYLPTGYNCADGTPPYFGALASNLSHLGQHCKLYRQDGSLIGEFISHDIGGHPDLVNGSALDIFCETLDDAWSFLYANAWVEGGSWYAWCEWE